MSSSTPQKAKGPSSFSACLPAGIARILESPSLVAAKREEQQETADATAAAYVAQFEANQEEIMETTKTIKETTTHTREKVDDLLSVSKTTLSMIANSPGGREHYKHEELKVKYAATKKESEEKESENKELKQKIKELEREKLLATQRESYMDLKPMGVKFASEKVKERGDEAATTHVARAREAIAAKATGKPPLSAKKKKGCKRADSAAASTTRVTRSSKKTKIDG